MKVLKIFILAVWVISVALFVIGVLTPLSFSHKAFLYLTFFIAFNGIFLLSYLLTDFVRLKLNNVMIGVVGSLLLISTYEFYPKTGSGWKTENVVYVHKVNPNDVIEFQKNDMGVYGYDYRIVKIINITPLYKWITVLKKIQVNNDWLEVEKKTSTLNKE